VKNDRNESELPPSNRSAVFPLIQPRVEVKEQRLCRSTSLPIWLHDAIAGMARSSYRSFILDFTRATLC
jgi:hypothetical protein